MPSRGQCNRPNPIGVYESPPIVVESPRLTEDQRITNDVVDVLAHDPYLSGRIGVPTYDGDVNLSGSVTTPGQVRRAGRNHSVTANDNFVKRPFIRLD